MNQHQRLKLPNWLVLSTLLFPQHLPADEQDNTLNKKDSNILIVTAELEDSNVLELPSSVTVISQEIIERRNAQHLTDLLNLAPNVNFATGASRGRFIQIRGVGERSEFREPVNYSVGVVLDGIDLTGIATAATTLDIQQIEILRGPQGTLYGANGLAGLINLVSNSPTENFYSKLSTSIENFSGRELSAVVSGPISEQSGYRFAVKQFKSDGFIDNAYLGRSDTNNFDEFSLRGKIVSQLLDNVSLTSSIFLANIDNGYDAFSLDSNRTTLSDQPGFDRQKTKALSMKLNWTINQTYWLESSLSVANSALDYAFDEDWSFTGICENTVCDSDLFGFDWWFSSFDQYSRNNGNINVDIKIHSVSDSFFDYNWVAGFYFRDQKIDLTRKYTFEPIDFSSDLNTKNIAFYGQLESLMTEQITLTGGLRVEQRSSQYNDNRDARFSPKENLWGGKISLEYQIASKKIIYGLISRGYKNGGFNTDASIDEENRLFDTEIMWNYEAGIKGLWLENRLTLQASVFYQDRKDIQTKQSLVRSFASGLAIQNGGQCPCSFTGLTQNAAKGRSSGIEIELRFQVSDTFDLYSSLGLLDAEFTSYSSFTHVDADLSAIPPIAIDLSGRDVAHAPKYQAVVGVVYFLTDQLSFNFELEAKDDFFFSDRHNLKSDPYEITHVRVNYQASNWKLFAYVNNIGNKAIKTRGFGSFGNDPRNFYARGSYFQFGAPRIIGLAFSWEFE